MDPVGATRWETGALVTEAVSAPPGTGVSECLTCARTRPAQQARSAAPRELGESRLRFTAFRDWYLLRVAMELAVRGSDDYGWSRADWT